MTKEEFEAFYIASSPRQRAFTEARLLEQVAEKQDGPPEPDAA